jgi:hypothetical protein
MSTRTRPIADLASMTGGPLIWAAHFGLTYGSQTMFCARAQHPDTALFWVIEAVVTASACAALLALAYALRIRIPGATDTLAGESQGMPFVRHVAMAGIGLALLAIVWSTLPTVLLEPCGPPAL